MQMFWYTNDILSLLYEQTLNTFLENLSFVQKVENFCEKIYY